MKLPRAELPAFFQASITSPLPVPRNLIFLTGASVPGALALLVISLLDLGYLSMRLNPCVSIYTLLYHIGFVFIGLKKRIPNAPSYFSTAVFSAYILTVVWFIAFILTIIVLAFHGHSPYYQVAWLMRQGLPVNVHTQRVQVFLTLYETIILGGLALSGHSIVHNEGPDPHDWRYAKLVKDDVESVREVR